MSIINLPGVALVTGANKGIGKATSFAFAAAGVKGLVLAGRNEIELKQTASLAKERAINPEFESLVVICDIESEYDIIKMVKSIIDKFGKIDYAVNNAGFIAQKFIPFADITTEEADKLVHTNQRGTFLCCREEIKAMLKQPRKDMPGLSGSTPECERGCIVNISSATALASLVYAGSYVHTAWGRYGMTKSAAVDHAADGIRVNALLVAYTVTDGFMGHPDATQELGAKLASENPMKRLATPEEAADAVIFLCSPLARYITGAGLAVDGGKSAII